MQLFAVLLTGLYNAGVSIKFEVGSLFERSNHLYQQVWKELFLLLLQFMG